MELDIVEKNQRLLPISLSLLDPGSRFFEKLSIGRRQRPVNPKHYLSLHACCRASAAACLRALALPSKYLDKWYLLSSVN
jgi:hypothetical protein